MSREITVRYVQVHPQVGAYNNLLINIEWGYGEDNQIFIDGTVDLAYPTEGDSIIPFESISEATLKSWAVEALGGQAALDEALDAAIAAASAPKVFTARLAPNGKLVSLRDYPVEDEQIVQSTMD